MTPFAKLLLAIAIGTHDNTSLIKIILFSQFSLKRNVISMKIPTAIHEDAMAFLERKCII